MPGLPKLFVILALLIAAWIAFRWLNKPAAPPVARRRPAAAPQGARGQAAIEVEDLVQCRVCGTYVSAGSPACGRAGCPRPR